MSFGKNPKKRLQRQRRRIKREKKGRALQKSFSLLENNDFDACVNAAFADGTRNNTPPPSRVRTSDVFSLSTDRLWSKSTRHSFRVSFQTLTLSEKAEQNVGLFSALFKRFGCTTTTTTTTTTTARKREL